MTVSDGPSSAVQIQSFAFLSHSSPPAPHLPPLARLPALLSTVPFASHEPSLTIPEAEAAIKPDSQKSYLEQGKDALVGKTDVSALYRLYFP